MHGQRLNLRGVVTRFLFVCGAVVVLVTGCGGSAPIEPSVSSSAVASATDHATAATTVAPAKPAHGILVATEEDGIIEVGMIDPADGSYLVENTFEVGDFAKGPNEPTVTDAIGFSMVVSPDRTRVMAQQKVNGDFHSGWITADGEFVDITAATLGQRSDFSGPVSTFGVGFNRQGNYHYGVRNGNVTELWSLPSDQTTGQTKIAEVGLLTRYRFDYDGAFQFALGTSCDDFSATSWAGDSYLYSDGTQIYRAARTVPDAEECAVPQPLLPDTNSAKVSDPVASPDLSEIAFVYTNQDSSRSIYVIAADGSGTPRKIDTVEWPSESARLVGWV